MAHLQLDVLVPKTAIDRPGMKKLLGYTEEDGAELVQSRVKWSGQVVEGSVGVVRIGGFGNPVIKRPSELPHARDEITCVGKGCITQGTARVPQAADECECQSRLWA